MAKRKPKPKSTVETIIALFLEGCDLTQSADDTRRKLAAAQANIDKLSVRVDRRHATGRRRLKRSAEMAGKLGPDGLAELLAKAPPALRTILVTSLEKMHPKP